MRRNHKSIYKYIMISFLLIIGIGTQLSLEAAYFNGVAADQKPEHSEQVTKPGHHKEYKLGMADDFEMSFDNYSRVETKNRNRRQERIAQKQVEKEKAEKEKQAEIEQAKQIERAKKEEVERQRKEAEAVREKKEVALAQSVSSPVSSNGVESTQNTSIAQTDTHSSQSTTETPTPKTVTRTESQAAPAPKPAPKPQAPAIGPSKIGINGIYHSYTNYGRASTDQLQIGIDAGLIVAGFTNFNGNDGDTTYFGGHNPGIMQFMENNIYIGAIVTVTDNNGEAHQYKMIDKVDVDEYGEGILSSIGRSAIDVYMYGTGTESILVQFCNTNNYLMSFWYGVKI